MCPRWGKSRALPFRNRETSPQGHSSSTKKTALNERTLKPNKTETLPNGTLRVCFNWFQGSASYTIEITYSDGTTRSIGPISFVIPLPGLYPLEKPEQRDWRKGH